MSWTIDASDWTRQLSSPFYDGNFTNSLRPSASSVVAMSLSLSTAGRLGFFIDYSELSDSGTHTFYVCRTHGSTGAVGVTYTTGGDTHTTTTGSMTWADGEMDIKSFTVDVSAGDLTTHQTTNGLGEHRMWALLSNPTGGGVLHFGTEHTRAYGVIDNNVLASDANAVFYDSAAVTNGTGTQASPYNSVYDAIANIGTKRYLYGKGLTTVEEGTATGNITGDIVNVLPHPSGRAGESDRVYVRNWAGNTWTIQGAGTNCGGFFTSSKDDYCTFKGIDFINFDNTNAGSETGFSGTAFAIKHLYSSAEGLTIEQCTADNINGGSNPSAYSLWGVNGAKVWRSTANNVQVFGSNTGGDGAMLLTYDGKNISVQRCESSNTSSLVYQKRIENPFDVSVNVRFCIGRGNLIVHYGRSGSSGVPHSYTVVQCNLFLPYGSNPIGIYHEAGSLGVNGSNNANKHWWCNNVFDSIGGGSNAPIDFRQAYNAAIFNNIYLNSNKLWRESQDSSSAGPVMEYADHELHFGTISTTAIYTYQAVDYANATALQAVRPEFAVNDAIADPLFTNPTTNDYTLQFGSPALVGGVSDTQKGLYLGDFYTIGAN